MATAFIQPYGDALTDYNGITERVKKVKGVTLAAPLVEGQVLITSPSSSSGARGAWRA